MELTGYIVDAVALLEGIGVDIEVEEKKGKPGSPAHIRAAISQNGVTLSTGKGPTARIALIRALLAGFGVPDAEAVDRTRSVRADESMTSDEAEGLRVLLLAAAMALNPDATVDDVADLMDDDTDEDEDEEDGDEDDAGEEG